MKIYLDLLPQQRKQEIKRKKTFHQILREEALFLLPIVLFIIILCNIYYIMTIQRDALISAHSREKSQDKYQQLGIYEEKFKQVNEISQTLGKIRSGHLHWERFLQELSKITPDGILISDLSTKNYTVFLIGKARLRDDILNFKNKLESYGCFQNINVPLSNLLIKNDVDFQMDFTISEDCLKKSDEYAVKN